MASEPSIKIIWQKVKLGIGVVRNFEIPIRIIDRPAYNLVLVSNYRCSDA